MRGLAEGREYLVEWLYTADARDLGPNAVLQLAGFTEGQTYFYGQDFDPEAILDFDGIQVRYHSATESNRKVWHITTPYRTNPRRACEFPTHPLDQPTRWGGHYFGVNKELIKDSSGYAVETSSGLPPARRIYYDEREVTFWAERNFATLNAQWDEYKGKLNAGSYWGFLAQTLRLVDWEWSDEHYADEAGCFQYFRCRFYFRHDPDRHVVKFIDEAEAAVNVDGDYVLSTSEYGYPLTGPQMLDGAGNFKAAGDPPAEISIDVYETFDFGLLGLPSTFTAMYDQ